MNYYRLIVPVTAFALLAAALPAAAQSVSANAAAGINVTSASVKAHVQTRAGASTTADRGQNRMENGQALGKTEIDKRIQSLQALSARIGAMKRLSASDVASLQASLSAQISSLTSLEATIAADTSTTSLKADVSSIAKGFRVYLLVLPQAQIAAAADRELTIAGQMQGLSAKFSARIDAVASAGTDVSALQVALSDMNAKVADASTQANAAVSETVSLQPDNGDASVQASNTATLKDARTKIQAAQADLKAAYKDAQTIQAGVKGKGTTASASTSASVTGH